MEEVFNCNRGKEFFCLARYYRRFVNGFSSLATPLTRLTRKNAKFVYNDECEKSFVELKKQLVTAPILTTTTSDVGYVIYSHASGKGLGCVFMQHGKAVAYASR